MATITTCLGKNANRGTERVTTSTATGGAGCAATPTQSVLGGPAPSWTTYAYDKTGNRTTETRHAATTGGVDTIRAYTYKAPSGAGANTGPHQLTSLVETTGTTTRTDTTGYDNNGNVMSQTTTRGTQSFTYDEENNLTVTTGPGASTYLYDAGGARLIRRDTTAGVTTLYLGDTEITLTTTGVLSSTRYYSLGGSQVAVRTGTGVTSVVTDHHNTGTLEINNDTGQITAIRRSDPFGNPRTTTSTGTWLGSKGFVAGTQDPTGYTQLGERAYQASTGRFLALDPILDPQQPQQLHGYAYANNNPINLTDPTGLWTNPLSWAWNKAKAAAAAAAARWQAIQRAIGYAWKAGNAWPEWP